MKSVKIFIEVCVLFHNLLVEVYKLIRKTLPYTAKPYEIERVHQNLILYRVSGYWTEVQTGDSPTVTM